MSGSLPIFHFTYLSSNECNDHSHNKLISSLFMADKFKIIILAIQEAH